MHIPIHSSPMSRGILDNDDCFMTVIVMILMSLNDIFFNSSLELTKI